MEASSESSFVGQILGDVSPTKSVLCCIFAFIEAVEEGIAAGGRPSSLRAIQRRVVKPNGIEAQGRLAPQHIAKFGLPTANIAGDKSGRKTPQARLIVPRLVAYLEAKGFNEVDSAAKVQMLHAASEPFRAQLGLSLGPIRVTPAGRSAAAVVHEVLSQAEERDIVSAIAELLVGSKLQICLGERHAAGIATQHKWENGHDDPNSLGDYRIENLAIEVTMVRSPDETHRRTANTITARGTDECWLIVRSEKLEAWKSYMAAAPSRYPGLVRCLGICDFVGQNFTETSCDPPMTATPSLKLLRS